MNALRELIINNFNDAVIIDNFRIGASGELYKREGCVCLGEFENKVRGAVADSDTVYVVSGNEFFTVHNGTVNLIGALEESSFVDDNEKVTMFVYANNVFVLGGASFYRYTKNSNTIDIIDGYAPIIDTIDDTAGAEIIIESCNALTARVRKKLKLSKTQNEHHIDNDVLEVRWVKLDGQLLDTEEYTIRIYDGNCYMYINCNKYQSSNGDIEVEFTLHPRLYEHQRSEILSCKKAHIYETENGPILLLYDGDLLPPGTVYFTKNPDAPTDDYGFLDYFIKDRKFIIGDGTKEIRSILRWGERTVAVTSMGIYLLQVRYLSNGDVRFDATPINTEIEVSKCSGSAVYENRLYVINENGLYCVSYDPVTAEYTTNQIEIDSRFIPSRNDYERVKLHLNKPACELWCCLDDIVAVYSLKYGVWYRFIGFSTNILFTYNSATAFSSGNAVNLFDEKAYDDAGVGFDAILESKNINFGNVFSDKTIYGFGAAFERCDGAVLECILENDKGNTFSVTVKSDENGVNSPVVSNTHARLGNSAYIIYRLISPSYAAPANVCEIMLRYRVSGGV